MTTQFLKVTVSTIDTDSATIKVFFTWGCASLCGFLVAAMAVNTEQWQ